MNYDIKDIASILDICPDNLSERSISVLLTDSRSLTFATETLFFAIKSCRNDGHRFVTELYNKGVRAFVVDNISQEWSNFKDADFLLVANVTQALQVLAANHRRKFDVSVIGIAGSNGKTIVKEWLYQLLRNDFFITRSPRSYNSQIGVPLSVWNMEEHTQLGIFEAGISKRGEMAKIERIIKPTIGVFTYLGDAHQENFSSIEEKIEEKLLLFSDVSILIYNADEAKVKNIVCNRFKDKKLVGWSASDINAPLFINSIEKCSDRSDITYTINGIENRYSIPFIEDASVVNSIHALAVMIFCFKIFPADAACRLSLLEPVAMRLEVKEGKNGCTVINDTYNSDINSLEIALDFLSRRDTSKKVVRRLILSDILQSAYDDAELYRRVANLIARKKVDKFVGIGEKIKENCSLFPPDSEFYSTTKEFLNSNATDKYRNELILIKGSRSFSFDDITEELSLKKHETILEIDLDALINNYNFYKQRLLNGTKLICMVKAFGYGAGSYELTKTLQDIGCDYVAVAVADEGAELRKAGITMPIMVMNPEMNSFDTLFRYNLEPEVYSFRLLNALIRSAQRQGITEFPIHIKIDSGMHRLGFTINQIARLVTEIRGQSSVMPRSVFSHFAGSDDKELDYFTANQIDIFCKCADELQNGLGRPIIRHILNTAGILRFPEYQFEGVRLGIGLYGVSPCSGYDGLRCVSSLKTTILQIKELGVAETVGYGRKGLLSRRSNIAAVPIGYADGLDRHLGNGNGCMFVNGMRAPIIGNICMDVTMLDVTGIDCREGDIVEVFGRNISVAEIAEKLGTIPYEILTSVSSRVKRVYYRE